MGGAFLGEDNLKHQGSPVCATQVMLVFIPKPRAERAPGLGSTDTYLMRKWFHSPPKAMAIGQAVVPEVLGLGPFAPLRWLASRPNMILEAFPALGATQNQKPHSEAFT